MNIRWIALLPALVCCQLAAAQANDPDPSQSLPQVDVEAKRAKLHAMENQLYAFEDQFFAEYNKLNDQRAYEVRCGWEMRQHFRVHQCRPMFQEWAEHETGTVFGYATVGSTYSSGVYNPNTVALRTRDYQKHMIALVRKHTELLTVLKERAELAKNYTAFRAELLKDKTFTWD